MNDTQEVAKAIYEEHKGLTGYSTEYADSMAKAAISTLQQLGWAPRGGLNIDIAPKDGTKIILMSEQWSSMPIAHWGEYPGNPVESEDGKEVCMSGWLIEDQSFCAGCEDGFLGWNEDITDGVMPTHFIFPPPPKEMQE